MDTKTALMDAAEQQLRKNGYNAISFRDLAQAQGIKSASVHYHFPKKEDLGLALVARYADRFFDDLAARTVPTDTPAQRLSAFCAAYRAALVGAEAMCLCGMLGAETRSLPDRLSEAVATFFEQNMAWVAAALPPDWPAERRQARARYMVSALQGAMMVSTVAGSVAAFDDTVEQVLASCTA